MASVISGKAAASSPPLRERSTEEPSAARAAKARKPSHFGSANQFNGRVNVSTGVASFGSAGSSITSEGVPQTPHRPKEDTRKVARREGVNSPCQDHKGPPVKWRFADQLAGRGVVL